MPDMKQVKATVREDQLLTLCIKLIAKSADFIGSGEPGGFG